MLSRSQPAGFARLVERCHQAGIGLILDWVPAHFPIDPHGLAQFDGTALYEYANPLEGFHQDWETLIYNLGSEADAESDSLHTALQQATWEGSDRPVFSIPVALSLLVFFALCAQCSSTLVVLRRETNSWKWPLFTFVYMTTLAYLGAWVVYHVGSYWS